MKFLFYIFVVCTLLSSCDRQSVSINPISERIEQKPEIPAKTVNNTDTALHLVNGAWYYRQAPFSGTLCKRYASGVIQSTQQYYQGREEGLYLSFYEDGSKEACRYYHKGEKDSVHTGWWPNGNLRYEYHFSNGIYEGDFKEWYVSGKPLKHIIYKNGKEQSGKGWRENGKPYMSFVMKDGRLYGQINPNLCYSLSNGKGEFRQSVP